jgi:hypothetical protein
MNKLRLGTPINIPEVMIIPVERIDFSDHKMQQGIWLYGSKEIAALVMHTPYSIWAFDMNGHELSVDKLTCDVPELKEILAVYPNPNSAK